MSSKNFGLLKEIKVLVTLPKKNKKRLDYPRIYVDIVIKQLNLKGIIMYVNQTTNKKISEYLADIGFEYPTEEQINITHITVSNGTVLQVFNGNGDHIDTIDIDDDIAGDTLKQHFFLL